MPNNWFIDWMMANSNALLALGALSLVLFVGTLVALPLVIIFLPARFFDPEKIPPRKPLSSMSTSRVILVVIKNAIGAVFVLGGLVMLVLPGQGLVTLLIGLLLMNLPGKRRMIRRMLRQPKVLAFVNRVRTAAKRPPVAPPN